MNRSAARNQVGNNTSSPALPVSTSDSHLTYTPKGGGSTIGIGIGTGIGVPGSPALNLNGSHAHSRSPSPSPSNPNAASPSLPGSASPPRYVSAYDPKTGKPSAGIANAYSQPRKHWSRSLIPWWQPRLLASPRLPAKPLILLIVLALGAFFFMPRPFGSSTNDGEEDSEDSSVPVGAKIIKGGGNPRPPPSLLNDANVLGSSDDSLRVGGGPRKIVEKLPRPPKLPPARPPRVPSREEKLTRPGRKGPLDAAGWRGAGQANEDDKRLGKRTGFEGRTKKRKVAADDDIVEEDDEEEEGTGRGQGDTDTNEDDDAVDTQPLAKAVRDAEDAGDPEDKEDDARMFPEEKEEGEDHNDLADNDKEEEEEKPEPPSPPVVNKRPPPSSEKEPRRPAFLDDPNPLRQMPVPPPPPPPVPKKPESKPLAPVDPPLSPKAKQQAQKHPSESKEPMKRLVNGRLVPQRPGRPLDDEADEPKRPIQPPSRLDTKDSQQQQPLKKPTSWADLAKPPEPLKKHTADDGDAEEPEVDEDQHEPRPKSWEDLARPPPRKALQHGAHSDDSSKRGASYEGAGRSSRHDHGATKHAKEVNPDDAEKPSEEEGEQDQDHVVPSLPGKVFRPDVNKDKETSGKEEFDKKRGKVAAEVVAERKKEEEKKKAAEEEAERKAKEKVVVQQGKEKVVDKVKEKPEEKEKEKAVKRVRYPAVPGAKWKW